MSTINILLREFLSIHHSFCSDVFNKIRIEIGIVIGESFFFFFGPRRLQLVNGFICNCILLIKSNKK